MARRSEFVRFRAGRSGRRYCRGGWRSESAGPAPARL